MSIMAIQPRRIVEGLSEYELDLDTEVLIQLIEDQLNEEFEDWYMDGDLVWHIREAKRDWLSYVK